jgi:uncharacterized repeat protein (TIGR01451 family)
MLSYKILFLFICCLYFESIDAQVFSNQKDTIYERILSAGLTYPVDLDNDGDLDIIYGAVNIDSLFWLENLGNVNYASPKFISDSIDYLYEIYAADLDNDGDVDILSASFLDDKIAWYENYGNGSFSGQKIITTNADFAVSVYAIDLDGDGDNDVLSASSNDNKIAYYSNLGNGTFSGEKLISIIATEVKSVYAIDLDGDGDNDIMSAAENGEIAWYKNLGVDSFSTAKILPSTLNRARTITSMDLDGDNDNDILVAGWSSQIGWFENIGSDSFSTISLLTGGTGRYEQVQGKDVDRDGDNDIIYTLSSAFTNFAEIGWYENLGNGIFSTKTVLSNMTIGNRFIAPAADIDNDGDLDLVTSIYRIGQPVSDLVLFENLSKGGVVGQCFEDFNQNCLVDTSEENLANRIFIINPGNLVVSTDDNGIWSIDSLPVGNYSIISDSSQSWVASCPTTTTFTVSNSNALIRVPSFGYVATDYCPSPLVSIFAPFLRPGFSNQAVYIQVCNDQNATALIDSTYVIIDLDPRLIVDSSSYNYINLGNDQYQIDLPPLFRNECIDIVLFCTVIPSAILGTALCMKAELLPLDSCILDTVPLPYPINTIQACNTNYDGSNLAINGICVGDSVAFVIRNIGSNMSCFAPVRLFANTALRSIDSIQLLAGDSIKYTVSSESGKAMRMEVSQHPLYPGTSRPNSMVEYCGSNIANWTSGFYNSFYQDDANSNLNIHCGVITGSYDPNIKTGFPLGIGSSKDILPNEKIEYLVQFQNTGSDTAFTVVIRDTLSSNFDIFSIKPTVASHDYEFKIYGPRILEWTFNNIMLPDSNTNEPASNGFLTFSVEQVANLSNGTLLENSAAIFFDFNAPIITNTSMHTVNENFILYTNFAKQESLENELIVKIYPNPSQDLVYIYKTNDELININILDVTGKQVLRRKSNDLVTKLDLRGFPSGSYFIVINTNTECITKKMIKL